MKYLMKIANKMLTDTHVTGLKSNPTDCSLFFFSFFFRLFVQRTLLFNTYMCSNHDMLHAQFRTDLHFRTLDLILNFFFILRYVFYSPSYHIIFFSEVCFFSIRPKENIHIPTQKKRTTLCHCE